MNINALYESRTYHNLADLFANEKSGLLDNIQATRITTTSVGDTQLMAQFNEILAFYHKHQRIPMADSDDFDEELLGISLDSIKANPEQKKILASVDTVGLLNT